MKFIERLKLAGIKGGTLANELGITAGAVSQWDKVPAGRVLDVERVTGISRHDLRPDIYPREARQ